MKRLLVSVVTVFLGVIAANAEATVILTPELADWVTDDNRAIGAGDLDDYTSPVFAGLSLLYKQDFGGGESGTFTGSYSTTFGEYASGVSDPSGATIAYRGGPRIGCPLCVLIVKDGNRTRDPEWSQYLFNLGKDTDPVAPGVQLLWNGIEDILITGFWPDNVNGAISHVAIFGTITPGGQSGGGGTAVPEPASLLLLGFGLLTAAALASRRRSKKT